MEMKSFPGRKAPWRSWKGIGVGLLPLLVHWESLDEVSNLFDIDLLVLIVAHYDAAPKNTPSGTVTVTDI